MIDCSHANSSKKHENQPIVAKDIADQLASGDKTIFGYLLSDICICKDDMCRACIDLKPKPPKP